MLDHEHCTQHVHPSSECYQEDTASPLHVTSNLRCMYTTPLPVRIMTDDASGSASFYLFHIFVFRLHGAIPKLAQRIYMKSQQCIELVYCLCRRVSGQWSETQSTEGRQRSERLPFRAHTACAEHMCRTYCDLLYCISRDHL